MKIINIDKNPFDKIMYKSSGPKKRPSYNNILNFYWGEAIMPKNINYVLMASDLQGRELGEKNRLLGSLVAEKMSDFSLDAVFLMGDLYDVPECNKRSGFGPVDTVWNDFAKISKKVFGVMGNHDVIENAEQLGENVTIFDGKEKLYENLVLNGVSGVTGNPNKNQRKSDEVYFELLKKTIKKRPDILMLHQGPSYKENKGDVGINQIIKTSFSGLLLFGHCFWENDWFFELGQCQALNVDNRIVIFKNKKG